MTTEHTPGPWSIKDDSGLPMGMAKLHKNVVKPYIVDADGLVTAFLFSVDIEGEGYSSVEYHNPLRDAEANAHLIAAAPELLAALEDMARRCPLDITQEALDVIKKAKGLEE